MVRETRGSKRERAKAIVRALVAAYPDSTCALEHSNPFQLLVATVLSAQTTDIAVNKVTPRLFARFPNPQAMAQAPEAEVERIIGSIGLWRAKAKHLRALSAQLVEHHGGIVPADLAALTALPGVGHKTATAVLSTAFGIEAGVTVDTHMLRINRLLKLSSAPEANRMARELEKLLDPEDWGEYTHRVIDHGRLVCVARRPRCGVCPLQPLCPSAFNPKVGYKPSNDDEEPASAKGLSWVARSPASNTTPPSPAPQQPRIPAESKDRAQGRPTPGPPKGRSPPSPSRPPARRPR